VAAPAFRAAGGWAVIGNGVQVIRYSGLTGNALTGIPATGPGAIVASISYNSTVTAAPLLIGVPASGDGAIVYTIAKGDDVNLWIQVDDARAQAAAALLFTSAAGGAHSGIIEDVIQDRRLSAEEARARGAAHLAERRDVQLRIRYRSRDVNARSGRTVTVNLLGAPYAVSAQFIIQSVTIRDFTPACADLRGGRLVDAVLVRGFTAADRHADRSDGLTGAHTCRSHGRLGLTTTAAGRPARSSTMRKKHCSITRSMPRSRSAAARPLSMCPSMRRIS
jgi:hypothetical protein